MLVKAAVIYGNLEKEWEHPQDVQNVVKGI